ncbi:peptidase m48 family protein [Moniliophthora roreri]|nr:peptidase m48 family protein [Moniliophthora roreri]
MYSCRPLSILCSQPNQDLCDLSNTFHNAKKSHLAELYGVENQQKIGHILPLQDARYFPDFRSLDLLRIEHIE